MREGIVPGGGATYIHLLDEIPRIKKNLMEDSYEQIGADIVAMVWKRNDKTKHVFLTILDS